MRVTGLFVDGFGIFSGREIRDLSPGLTVLYGPNEAGKSTLLAFLRGVLFGFPRPARNRRTLYPPLAGGRHGGRVFLETRTGNIAIERQVGQGARISLELGPEAHSDLSEAEFLQLVGGVDGQTFRTVFAFSLDELQDFESLNGEQVRARIFAAGVGGAGPSVRQVIQGMERTCGRLLKPRSLEGEINRTLNEIETCEQMLQQARSLAESYPVLIEEQESARARLQSLDEREQELRGSQVLNERLLDLWPVWVDIESSRRELDSLDQVDVFVPEAVRRLTEAKEGMESAQRSLAKLEEQRARRSKEIAELQAGLRDELWELASEVEAQVGQLPVHRGKVQEMETVRGRVAVLEDRLRQSLKDLGPTAGEESLATVDTSLPRFEEIRAWRLKLGEALGQTRQATEQLDLATAQRVRAEAEVERERAALEELPRVDADELAAKMSALRAVRAGIADLRAKQAVLDGRLSASTGLTAEGSRVAASRAPSVRLVVGAAAAVAILIVVAAIAAGAGRTVLAAVAGALAALGLLALVMLAPWRRLVEGVVRGKAGMPAEWWHREQMEQETLRRDISRLELEVAQPAAVLGLADLADGLALERSDESLSAAGARMSAWNEQRAALNRAELRLRDGVLEESLSLDRLERFRDGFRVVESDFQARIAEWGLPGGLSPEGIEEYLRGLAAAKELAGRLNEDRDLIGRLDRERSAREAECLRLAEAAGVTVDAQNSGLPSPDAVESALMAVSEACRTETEIRKRIADISESNREVEVEIEQAQVAVAASKKEWELLMREAGAGDEAEFLRKLSIFEKRQDVKQNLSVRENMLVKSLGRGREADAFRDFLARGEVTAWEGRLEQARSEIEETRAEVAVLTKVEGDIERRLRELEESADVPSIETELDGLQSELAASLEQWQTNCLAGLLVRETLAQFTQERQPLVLAEASRMFERVTQGRYVRVQRSTDEDGIVVVDLDGRLKTPDELSRGAAEQLYLCLRLGLAEEFARRAEPMPLVMDDVLVNFDGARRRTTAEVLIDFAERHQILFFTCHEEIADLVQGLRPEISVIALS